MARPDTTLSTVNSQVAGWDQIVDQNNSKLRDLLFNEPTPTPIVHRATADSGSSPLSSFSAADYKWCVALCVDAASPSTNGVMIYSDGSNWKYQKSNSNV